MNKQLKKAANIIKRGGIIIYPTDTAFGVGCRIDNVVAVKKLFRIRKRPREKAFPVLVSSKEMAGEYVEKIERAEELMNKYWPGGLTIVMPCKKNLVHSTVRGGGDTIGVRMPNHKTAIELIRLVGVPILAPSANFSGGKTPFRRGDLDPELVKLVDFVMPGRCSVKKPSTVLDINKKPWKILRRGAVKISIKY
jgi:L-threonylcarbamoyladenylate synthase